MFYNLEELAAQATAEYGGDIAELMIVTEMETTNRSRAEIWAQMEENLKTMEHSVAEGIAGVHSRSGLTGGDAPRMNAYVEKGDTLCGEMVLTAVRNAIAVNEVNARMGLICATPTAGSAGCLAAVLTAVRDSLNLTHEDQVKFLFVAGAIGLVIANNASIAGAEGGCQAEVGSASAMASAALVAAKGGTPDQATQAVAIVLKNMLGLICDPVAGLVEVPCVLRNAMGSTQAMMTADMVLAGVRSVIPPDEVVTCMYQVGRMLPSAHRETAEGGLAATPTGKRLMQEIFG
ncbi:MAG: L-serine ammonia-lyase, iron-sulfur-dependent, subunit alpha [Lactobacillaceae bacterium]|jgi:L-serine dehydratase|nr:L-serine ammonia-lyase, iron-sulfur-dependent, subunit alpha [Lactobacillaceae bacterium]